MDRPLRIAQVAPPLERVPPEGYGGTERVMYELIVELVRRGHDVTTFASGDSDVPGHHVPTVPMALRPADFKDDPMGYFLTTMLAVLDSEHDFDIIHSHLEWSSVLLARAASVPVVATFHGRLDLPWSRELLASPSPASLVAISQSQASAHPDVDWTVVHNGLTLGGAPLERRRSEALCFVGRVAIEKGIVEAIDIARIADRPLRIAAKIAPTGAEHEYYEEVFLPALKAAGPAVEFLGEVSGAERDELLADSYAALMPGSWPEPFGLAAIEALACGTPVLARRVGGLTEIIRDGIDGFFGDDATELAFRVPDVESLDRRAIRKSVIERFSASRMTDGYEALYRRVLGKELNGGDKRFVDLKTLAPTQAPKAGVEAAGYDRPMTINVPEARLTVALTFDHDAISDAIRRGDPPVKVSHGEFGPRVGAPRILELLASRGIPSTWFVPGHTLEAFPESIAAIVDGGHELASHGWYHEDFAELSVDEQRDVLGRSFDALTTARDGTTPTGWRAPYWSLGPRTLELVEAAGFRYDSSLMADDARLYRVRTGDRHSVADGTRWGREGTLVEVPVYWAMDDWPHFEPAPERGRDGLAAPSKVLEIWTAELRYAWEHAPGGLCMVTMHPECIGRGHRMAMLEQFIDAASALEGVVFERLDTVVERFSAGAGVA